MHRIIFLIGISIIIVIMFIIIKSPRIDHYATPTTLQIKEYIHPVCYAHGKECAESADCCSKKCELRNNNCWSFKEGIGAIKICK